MKKALFAAIFSILLFAIPASAQRRGGGGNQHQQRGESRGGGSWRSQPRQDNRGRGVEHNYDRRQDQRFHENQPREGYHYAAPRRDFRDHWDGRRFDRDFFEAHWGYRHPFYWSHCGWYGPRFEIGSYFWYDGVYFDILEPIPSAWWNDDIVVVFDPDCGCYYVVDPLYPGVRVHVGIRF